MAGAECGRDLFTTVLSAGSIGHHAEVCAEIYTDCSQLYQLSKVYEESHRLCACSPFSCYCLVELCGIELCERTHWFCFRCDEFYCFFGGGEVQYLSCKG
jgi:hypothetical protein